MNSSTNTSNSISSMPELSQAELDKLILTPEAKAHYSQENEIKRLIIERETYKRAFEQQQEYFKQQYETLFLKMNFSKMPRFKIVNEIDYIRNFIFYY
jgi:hypothetical protein